MSCSSVECNFCNMVMDQRTVHIHISFHYMFIIFSINYVIVILWL